MVKQAPNQNVFIDQSFISINLEKMYDDFIKEIDKMRSNVSINDIQGIISTIAQANFNTIPSNVNISNKPQESRAHAFYRLIGLPIVSDTNTQGFYNPGFDKDLNFDKVKIQTRIETIKSFSKNLLSIMSEREKYVNQTILPIFSRQDVSSSVLALSAYNIRQFANCMQTTDPFDFDKLTQKHTDSGLDYKNRLFSSYRDVSDNPPKIMKDRFHFIRPLIVDPRIDLTVQSSSKRVCVPFLSDKSKSQLVENIYLRRPLIEKICSDKFAVLEEQKSTAEQEIIDYFNSLDTVQDSLLVENFNNGSLNLTQQQYFFKFFSILKALVVELFKNRSIIQQANKFYWVPIPNASGPEFGSTTRSILLVDNVQYTLDGQLKNGTGLNERADQNIVRLNAKYKLEQAYNKIQVQQKDTGNFVFSGADIFSVDNSEAIENNSNKQLDKLLREKKDLCDRANDALKNIEIITGEFSGLGLIDIIVMIASLYLMDNQYLLGLLDNDAFDRMRTFPKFAKIEDSERADIAESLTKLNETVKAFYDLTDKLVINFGISNPFFDVA